MGWSNIRDFIRSSGRPVPQTIVVRALGTPGDLNVSDGAPPLSGYRDESGN